MLHEILLSLSGVQSPIWADLENDRVGQQDDTIISYTSPAERAMLRILAELTELHIKVREATTQISRSHPSPTCRAVSSRIKTKHLKAFTDKIIRVETSILRNDATFVGAYQTVSLSTIVSEFEPWLRPLRWLWKTVEVLQPSKCSSALVMGYLKRECYTGYTNIKELAEDALIAAQKAWVQSLTPWILYGQLPHFGQNDFIISLDDHHIWSLRRDLVPDFVSANGAESVLAIGKALNQIKSRGSLDGQGGMARDICTVVLPSSLERIQSLSFPISTNNFENNLRAIDQNVSQMVLSHLLPTHDIQEFLQVVQDYVLLGNGEFSTSLLTHADETLQGQRSNSRIALPIRKLGKPGGLVLDDSQIASILDKTWSELASFLSENQVDDPVREKAIRWLRLKSTSNELRLSTLVPTPVSLVLDLPVDSPMHIFVSDSDIERYGDINSYLISLQRSQAQLAKLWKISAHRRCFPSPLGPSIQGHHVLEARRKRENQRHVKLRAHWACASQALFLISEMISYFHGEVILNSWQTLHSWLQTTLTSRPVSSGMTSRPVTATSRTTTSQMSNGTLTSGQSTSARGKDPRNIARAHQQYLQAISHALLLEDQAYISLAWALLYTIDHFVALFQRLQLVWEGLDLQEDEGIMDAFSNHRKDEEDLYSELSRTNADLTDQLRKLVLSIREAGKQRDLADMTTGVARMTVGTSGDDDFEPWKARTLDRLLMKLDSLAVDGREDGFEEALVDTGDD